jgi:hypothetical protein
MSLGEWVVANADWLERTKTKCEGCGGKGQAECNWCGNVAECKEYNGSGWLYGDDGKPVEALYNEQKRRDLKQWARWHGVKVPK